MKALDFARNGVVLPNNLFLVVRRSEAARTQKIYLKWLPLPKEKDWRPNEGRDKNNKRLPFQKSLETENLLIF